MRTGYEITEEDFRRLRPKLYAQIQRLGIRRDHVEDLVQETFLHAQAALDRGRFAEQSSLDTWIVGIGKKRTLKYLRRQTAAKRKGIAVTLDQTGDDEPAAAAVVPDPGPSPDRVAADRQAAQQTTRALEDLPDEFRQPLVLLVQGLSYRQISSVLGISTGLVTSRVHQARSKLRRATARPPRGSPD